MLPVPLQFVIAMIASAINDRTQRRLAYLEEEVAVLQDLLASATGTNRIRFSALPGSGLLRAPVPLNPRPERGSLPVVADARGGARIRSSHARGSAFEDLAVHAGKLAPTPGQVGGRNGAAYRA